MNIDGSIKDKHGYPRPIMERPEWTNLNGLWDFAIDADAQWSSPTEVPFDRRIVVPFSPETKLSGIHETGFYRAVWYRREIETPDLSDGRRLILHFGAVDYATTVWINGRIAGKHEGGYTPFHLDITDLLSGTGTERLEVRARGRPCRPYQTPRQTRLATRAAFYLVPPHHRNLADGLDGARQRHAPRLHPLDAGRRTLGNWI